MLLLLMLLLRLVLLLLLLLMRIASGRVASLALGVIRRRLIRWLLTHQGRLIRFAVQSAGGRIETGG